MEKLVYLICEYDLIGAKLYTYEAMPQLKETKFLDKNNQEASNFLFKGDGSQFGTSSIWKLTTNLSKYKKETLFDASKNKFLPYVADVTQDLPGWVKFKPKTYKNCKLMVEKHGSYLQFYHEPTGEVLRIAMNSNTYKPVTKYNSNS